MGGISLGFQYPAVFLPSLFASRQLTPLFGVVASSCGLDSCANSAQKSDPEPFQPVYGVKDSGLPATWDISNFRLKF